MVYLQNRLERLTRNRLRLICVLPLVEPLLCEELCTELRAAFPEAAVDLTAVPGRRVDVLVVPFTRRLHRRFVREKTRLIARAARAPARLVLLYDVTHRRTELVARRRLPVFYLQRLLEGAVASVARRFRWRRS